MKIVGFILAVSVSVVLGGEMLQIDGKPVEIVKTGQYSPEAVSDKLAAQSFADTLLPVRRSFEYGQVFWNGYARQFTYAPYFEFKPVEGAVKYRFTVKGADGALLEFIADSPYAALTPVWGAVREGDTTVKAVGIDADGKELGVSGERKFYRMPPFDNRYPPKAKPYLEAAKDTYHYLLTFEAIQHLKKGEPSPNYTRYCYPSKMHSAIIEGLLEHAELEPSVKAEAIEIATQSANFMIRTAIPAGQPLEYLPRTYLMPTTEAGKNLAAVPKLGTIMMIYPVKTGNAMIRLYKETKNQAYLDYAVKIGEQYLRLQREDGTWALVYKIEDGSVVADNACEPVDIVPFLNNLGLATGRDDFREAAERGMDIVKKRIKTLDWEGQFEDVNAQVAPYRNLSKHPAADSFLFITEIWKREGRVIPPEFIAQARESLRFAEDQFVVWRKNNWMLAPSAMEQYSCYKNVDASIAKMIRFYLLMYDLEKNPLDLAKARALGDSLTRIQMANGRIPTWCNWKTGPDADWINCMYAAAHALKLLSKYDGIQ